MTQVLITGGNPFAFENQPLAMNNYGILYELFVLPFAIVFGNTLLVHRAVSFFFILLCSAVSFLTLKKINNDVYLSGLCSILMAIVLTGRGGIGASPASVGCFFFLTAVLVPFNRSFDACSLLISILSCLLAFYTKPYFVLSFGIVASYLFLFVSKKTGVLYSISFCLFFLVTFALIRYFLTLYFVDILLGNISNADLGLAHLLEQLQELCREFFPSFALALLFLLINAVRNYGKEFSSQKIKLNLGWSNLDSALFRMSMDYFGYVFLIGLLAFIFILGAHLLNFMTYAYHVVMLPFFLWLFSKIIKGTRLALIAIPIFLLNAAWLSLILINPSFLQKKDSAGWSEIRAYVSGSEKVLNSPAIVSLLIEEGILPVDSGQTEFYYALKRYPDLPWLCPSYKVVKQNGSQYLWNINYAIANKEFDKLILTEEDKSEIKLRDRIDQYYVKVNTIQLDMPQTNEVWKLGVWEPIKPSP